MPSWWGTMDVAAFVPATLPAVLVFSHSGWLAIWPVRGRLITAAFAIGPAVLIAGLAAILDGATWFGERYPGPAAIVLGLVGIGVSPFLALAVEGRWWRGVLGWGLPLLVGGIMVFAGDVSYELYLEHFDISRSDVTVSLVQQWAMGAFVTSVLLLGVYSGVAFWAVGRRFVGRSLIGEAMTGLYLIILLVIIVLLLLVALERRAGINENGLPTGLIGLEPRLVCVVPVNGPYSYVGQPIAPTTGAVVYFGRADGRLAVWSAQSGGVLLDGQAVALQFMQSGSTCS
jgi:hypothetical protein